MRRAVLLIAILTCVIILAYSQGYKGQGRATGLVTDESGKPLEGVTVKLYSVKGQSGFETKTNAKGEWRALYIRGGTWNIDLEKEGYMPRKLAVDLKEFDRNPAIEVRLERVEGLVILEALKESVDVGNRLFAEQRYEEAAKVFEDIVAGDENAYMFHKNLGNCYFQLQDYERAERHYLKVLEKEPENAEVMLLIGNTYSNRDDQAKALEWYGKIELDKMTDATALFNIANSLFSRSNFEEALRYSRRGLEVQPDSTDLLYLTGLIHLSLDHKPDSIEAFECYLKLDPDSARAGQVRNFLEVLKK
jgi:tetratricopeptide (TPR) repeat protein